MLSKFSLHLFGGTSAGRNREASVVGNANFEVTAAHREYSMRLGSQSGGASPYPPAVRETVPDGDAGIEQTIRHMQRMMYSAQGISSWVVREFATKAVQGVERGQPEIDCVFNSVKDNIEFRGEAGEYLQSPEATINLGAGDCDDQATLVATLLRSLGYQTDFRTVAMRGSEDEYTHVYAVVRDKETGQWIPLDTTVERAYPGWEPDHVARERTYGAASGTNCGLLGRIFSCLCGK
jgi:transglutaminase-like putative cysteine protease